MSVFSLLEKRKGGMGTDHLGVLRARVSGSCVRGLELGVGSWEFGNEMSGLRLLPLVAGVFADLYWNERAFSFAKSGRDWREGGR